MNIIAILLLNQICFVTHNFFFASIFCVCVLCLQCIRQHNVTHKVRVSSIHFSDILRKLSIKTNGNEFQTIIKLNFAFRLIINFGLCVCVCRRVRGGDHILRCLSFSPLPPSVSISLLKIWRLNFIA